MSPKCRKMYFHLHLKQTIGFTSVSRRVARISSWAWWPKKMQLIHLNSKNGFVLASPGRKQTCKMSPLCQHALTCRQSCVHLCRLIQEGVHHSHRFSSCTNTLWQAYMRTQDTFVFCFLTSRTIAQGGRYRNRPKRGHEKQIPHLKMLPLLCYIIKPGMF